MGEDLCGGRPAGRCGRELGRRTATQQGRADRTLSALKPTPDSPEGSVAAGTVGVADGGGDAAGDGPLEECPQGPGGQAQPPDSLGDPDADGPSAAAPAMAVAQKIRRARTVRRGLLSSKPVITPCRMSVPTVRQCGHGVSLSRSTIAAHSASFRQNYRSSLTIGPLPPNATERTGSPAGRRRGGSDGFDPMEERGRPRGIGRRTGPCSLPNSSCQTSRRIGQQFGKNSTKNAIGV